MEWIFMKDDKLNNPMFEIVLPHDYVKDENPPHFQIDLDTNLSQDDLLRVIKETY